MPRQGQTGRDREKREREKTVHAGSARAQVRSPIPALYRVCRVCCEARCET